MNKFIKKSIFSLVLVCLFSFGINLNASSYSGTLPGVMFFTDYATNVTSNSANLNASVFGVMDLYTVNNGQTVYFEYGTSQSNLNLVTESNGPVNSFYAKNVTNLTPNTKYYFRVVVNFGPNSNPPNTKQYGGVMNFTTQASGTATTNTTTVTTNQTTTTNTNNTTTNTNTDNNSNTNTNTNTTSNNIGTIPEANNLIQTQVSANNTNLNTNQNLNSNNTTNQNQTTTTSSNSNSNERYINALALVQSISVNLTIGSRGENVSKLQSFLIERNTGIASQRLAQVGATGYFGTLTRLALAEFQRSVGIVPAYGYFGPLTRAYLANLE